MICKSFIWNGGGKWKINDIILFVYWKISLFLIRSGKKCEVAVEDKEGSTSELAIGQIGGLFIIGIFNFLFFAHLNFRMFFLQVNDF